jgi:hypothetical protein
VTKNGQDDDGWISYIDMSKGREEYGKKFIGEPTPSYEDLVLGTLLRIAQYLEAMSMKDMQLLRERESLERWDKRRGKDMEYAWKKQAELRQQVQRLRERLKKEKAKTKAESKPEGVSK